MNALKRIPDSMTGLLVVMGALAPVMMLCACTNTLAMGWWIAIYAVIGAIAGLGVLVFDRKEKTKANDFAKSVETNASNADGVKDPQKIAQMDHMRKEFQRGIDIYKKHGKDLYSLPWYVVVGESESGKTEMLRRSEIGFPDKLQDKWQGAGGTLSMHWWFSNKAVILDTAGRLFVTEGTQSGQNQWVNFLQMLKRNRPDCPINGLILVIPSNRLLTHPDAELEAKSLVMLDENAGQIARQMETLQVELGVRFPVYILITKMDKLNGFREFFGKIEKPEDRYQIMGWSNPAPLGGTFDPQSVVEYIRSVADRLKRRMMSELRNVEPADNNGLRINEVDALYAFPSAFESMSPKLTRYLHQVFTTEEWSAKPPFLRGIYFTSALQQGKVLDEALAAAMGVPFDKMDGAQQDDGLSLSKNRTYFVRDLFLDKIFNEKGLITTGAKIRSQINGWKLWIPAMLILMLAVFGLLGWWFKAVNNEASRWNDLLKTDKGRKNARVLSLVTLEKSELHPAKKKEIEGLLTTMNRLGRDVVQGKPKFGWVFAPAQWFDSHLATNRQDLYADLVAEELTQVENAVIGKLNAEPNGSNNWKDHEWEVLHALMILQNRDLKNMSQKSEKPTGKDDPPAELSTTTLVETLFDYAGINKNFPKSPALFAECLGCASSLRNSTLAGHLSKRRQTNGLQELVAKALPKSDLAQQKKFAEDLNKFHEAFMATKGAYQSEKVAELAETADRLTGNKSGALDVRPGQTLKLAGSREALLQVVTNDEKLAKCYGFTDFTTAEGLNSGPKALVAADQRLLRQVAATLKILRNDASTLDAGNIDSFIQPQETLKDDDPEAPPLKAETKEILLILDTLKKTWFQTEFLPYRFYRYLKFPIARNADDIGSDEELMTLWKLCILAEDRVKKPEDIRNFKRLIATFKVFFEIKKTTSKEILVLRPCTAKVVHRPQEGSIIYTIKSGNELVAKFDIFNETNNPPAKAIQLDKPLTFLKSGEEDESFTPWGIVKRYQRGQGSKWQFLTAKRKTTYEIEIADANFNQLEDWPKIEVFKHAR